MTLLPAPARDTVARGGGSRGGSSGWEVVDRCAPRPASPGDGGPARLHAICLTRQPGSGVPPTLFAVGKMWEMGGMGVVR